MTSPPYSLSEAEQLCADFQHLVGQSFNKDFFGTIDCVAVAPFDETSKNSFFIYYLLFEDAASALKSSYKGLLFDVIIIGGSIEKNGLQHQDIYSWLTKSQPTTGQTFLHAGSKVTGE